MTERLLNLSVGGRRGAIRAVLLLATAGAVLAGSAAASNATLHTSVNAWSTRLGADARSVALAARRRHPRRMTYSALRFRRDALAARAAVGRQRASTARGYRAKRLAVTAFGDYAVAGGLWASSGRARLAHRIAAATAYARKAAGYARTGNGLLITAGKLLR